MVTSLPTIDPLDGGRGAQADRVIIDEAREIDFRPFEVYNEALEAMREHERYTTTIIRLERLLAAPFCAMTGRAGPYRRDARVRYTAHLTPVPTSAKFSNPEVAAECHEWARFLVAAMQYGRHENGRRVGAPFSEVAEYVLPPQPRLFTVSTFGFLAAPKKEGKRGRRR